MQTGTAEIQMVWVGVSLSLRLVAQFVDVAVAGDRFQCCHSLAFHQKSLQELLPPLAE